MQSKFTYKKLTWIDLESPTKDEVRRIMEKYDLHPLVAEELLKESVRPKADYYGNQIYLVLHFPTVSHTHSGRAWQEVDFVIGKNFLLTVHYESVDPLIEFSKMFQVNSVLEKSNMGEHAGFLFFHIIRELHKNLRSELETIRKALSDTEKWVFSGNEKEMVLVISEINRKLINFKQATRFHKEILESFGAAAKAMFGEKFGFYSAVIQGEQLEIESELLGHKETLRDLWATNDSLLSSRTNEIMKTLAVIAAILLPVSLVGQIFGISSDNIPYMDRPDAFYIVIGVMVFTAALMFIVSKWRQWL